MSGINPQELRQVMLFKDLSDNDLAALSQCMRVAKFSASSTIFKEGDAGSCLYCLTSGKVKVSKKTPLGETFPVAMLSSEHHAFLGETCLLEADARSATIVAETDCEAYMLDRKDFEKFAAEHAQGAYMITRGIVKIVMDRLKKANHEVTLLYHALLQEVSGRQAA